MRKLLGSTVTLALLLVASQGNAELLKNFKLGGQLDLQATAARNVADFVTQDLGTAGTQNDRIGDVQTRVMLHADWDLLDDVHAKVTLSKNNRTWNGTPENLDGVQTNVEVEQAYFKIDKLMGALDAMFGRQFYGKSGDMVAYFGPSDKAQYGLPVTALDSARFDWNGEHLGLTGVAGKVVADATPGLATVSHTDLRGLVAACKHTGVKAYVYNQVQHNTGELGSDPGKNDFLWVVGLKGKFEKWGGWIKGEAAKNFGEDRTMGAAGPSRNYMGWALMANAGYKADLGMAALIPWVEYAVGSGDESANDNKNHAFQAINPDYRPGSIYGRFATNSTVVLGQGALTGAVASNSVSNRNIWGLGVKATPAMWNKLTAGLSYWDFRFQKRPLAAAAAGNRHIGSEVDLDLTWMHSENVSLSAGFASFQPGGFIKTTNRDSGLPVRGTDPASLWYMDARLRF
ncbi:MAG: hypothetical protein HY549_08890 [Elusimicrobia bacterium]|nr:hypothetical protein [Elusimicrobiota bacterium]